MHIIGILIDKKCSSEIRLNLSEGWYPFGNYDEPTKEREFKWRIVIMKVKLSHKDVIWSYIGTAFSMGSNLLLLPFIMCL